jgi:Kef-type K+ transport system membrane component KefB
LIVASIGLSSGLITEDLFTSMVIVAIGTTVITPPLLRMVINKG